MKICDRPYPENHMLTMKVINGVNCCPACQKPVFCHGMSAPGRALYWALSDDTGSSSKALARHMTGAPRGRMSMPPSDSDDRGRCIRLLELMPEWIPRLSEMTQYDPKPKDDTGTITIGASGMHVTHNGWKQQIPLILTEGKLL